MENIVLIGMSGVGKTVVGKYISEKTSMKLIDTDDIIECTSGKSISYIFKNYGESYFRNLETKIIISLSHETNAIISTGGGAVICRKNMSSLSMNGIVFLLKANLDTMLRNINASKENRPLLENTLNIKNEIESINRKRRSLYASNADYEITVDNKSIEEVGDEIIYIYNQIKSI